MKSMIYVLFTSLLVTLLVPKYAQNSSFGVTTNNGWGLTLWGRNVTNDKYISKTFPSVAQPGSFSGIPNQPRTYDLTIKKNFASAE